jgi:hypothetical protein
MATATPHADRTASEARRPEAGSRAGGVSRAERGNDGSPTGARRRRGLDAQHDSATGHLPGGRGRPARGGDSPQGFPLEASEARSAPSGARRHHAESSGRRLDSETGIHGEDEFSR